VAFGEYGKETLNIGKDGTYTQVFTTGSNVVTKSSETWSISYDQIVLKNFNRFETHEIWVNDERSIGVSRYSSQEPIVLRKKKVKIQIGDNTVTYKKSSPTKREAIKKSFGDTSTWSLDKWNETLAKLRRENHSYDQRCQSEVEKMGWNLGREAKETSRIVKSYKKFEMAYEFSNYQIEYASEKIEQLSQPDPPSR